MDKSTLSLVYNFQVLQYLTKKYVLKFFKKVNIIKAPVGCELMDYSFKVNTLTHCTTLLSNKFGKEIFFTKIKYVTI